MASSKTKIPAKTEKFLALEDVYARIRELELEGGSKFCCESKDKHFGISFEKGNVPLLKKHKIHFEMVNGSLSVRIPYDGVPFINIARRSFACHRGKGKYKRVVKDEQLRQRKTSSKKINCPVHVNVKHIIKFPELKISERKEKAKRNAAKRLKQMIEYNEDITGRYHHEFHMTIPSPEEHQGHTTSGELVGFRPQLDPRVFNVMKEAVQLGVTKVNEIKNVIRHYVVTEIFSGQRKPKETDKCYYPTKLDIAKYVERSVLSLRDKSNTERLIMHWQQNILEDFIYFRANNANAEIPYIRTGKIGNRISQRVDMDALRQTWQVQSGAPLMFCYQSMWQKRLMSLFGNQMTYLDPVHKTLPCVYPLYFLSVLTNVGYMIVGVILLENQSANLLKEAMQIFRNWNPEWRPSYIMVGESNEDAEVVQATCKGARLCISDHHREVAWKNWITEKQFSEQDAEVIDSMLRDIAAAPSKEKLKKAVETLNESELWKNNEQLRVWFAETWHNRIKQWTLAYRDKVLDLRMAAVHVINPCHKPLKIYRNSPISIMISNILKVYLPDSYRRYTKLNVHSWTHQEKTKKLPGFILNSPNSVIEEAILLQIQVEGVRKGVITVGKEDFCTFTVDLGKGGAYHVDLGNPDKLPSCTCNHWSETKLPCVHFFAVAHFVPKFEWGNLSKQYRECLMFQRDRLCESVEPYSEDRMADVEMLETMIEEDDDEGADVTEVEESDSDMEVIDYGGISDSPCSSPEPAVVQIPESAEGIIPKSTAVEIPKSAAVEIPEPAAANFPEPAAVEISERAVTDGISEPAVVGISEPVAIEIPESPVYSKQETQSITPSSSAESSEPSSSRYMTSVPSSGTSSTTTKMASLAPKALLSDTRIVACKPTSILSQTLVPNILSTTPGHTGMTFVQAGVSGISSQLVSVTTVPTAQFVTPTTTTPVQPLISSSSFVPLMATNSSAIAYPLAMSRSLVSPATATTTLQPLAFSSCVNAPGVTPIADSSKVSTSSGSNESTSLTSATSVEISSKTFVVDSVTPVQLASSTGPAVEEALQETLSIVTASSSSSGKSPAETSAPLGETSASANVSSIIATVVSLGKSPSVTGSIVRSLLAEKPAVVLSSKSSSVVENLPSMKSLMARKVPSDQSPVVANIPLNDCSVINVRESETSTLVKHSSSTTWVELKEFLATNTFTDKPILFMPVDGRSSTCTSAKFMSELKSAMSHRYRTAKKQCKASHSKHQVPEQSSSFSSTPVRTAPNILSRTPTSAKKTSRLLSSEEQLEREEGEKDRNPVDMNEGSADDKSSQICDRQSQLGDGAGNLREKDLSASDSDAEFMIDDSEKQVLDPRSENGKTREKEGDVIPAVSSDSDTDSATSEPSFLRSEASDDGSPTAKKKSPAVQLAFIPGKNIYQIVSTAHGQSSQKSVMYVKVQTKSVLNPTAPVQSSQKPVVHVKVPPASVPNLTVPVQPSKKPSTMSLAPSKLTPGIVKATLVPTIVHSAERKSNMQQDLAKEPHERSDQSHEGKKEASVQKERPKLFYIKEKKMFALCDSSGPVKSALHSPPATELSTPKPPAAPKTVKGLLEKLKARRTPTPGIPTTTGNPSVVVRNIGVTINSASTTTVVVTPRQTNSKDSPAGKVKQNAVGSVQYQPALQSVETETLKPNMVSSSTQTDDVEIKEIKPKKAPVPKTRKQRLAQKCSDTWEHVGDTLKLVKDEKYLTQINEQLHNFLRELRQIVSVGRVENVKRPIVQIKEEPTVIGDVPVPYFDPLAPLEVSSSPAKRMRIEVPSVVENIVVGSDTQHLPGDTHTYYELTYGPHEHDTAVASIKLEEGMDTSGIQQIISAFNVINEEVVQHPP